MKRKTTAYRQIWSEAYVPSYLERSSCSVIFIMKDRRIKETNGSRRRTKRKTISFETHILTRKHTRIPCTLEDEPILSIVIDEFSSTS